MTWPAAPHSATNAAERSMRRDGMRGVPNRGQLVLIQDLFRHCAEQFMPPACPVVRDVGRYRANRLLVFARPSAPSLPSATTGRRL